MAQETISMPAEVKKEIKDLASKQPVQTSFSLMGLTLIKEALEARKSKKK